MNHPKWFLAVSLTLTAESQAFNRAWLSEPFLGVSVAEVPKSRELEVDELSIRFPSRGVFVVSVVPKSNADDAGIQVGDLIEAINDSRVLDVAAFMKAISKATPGEEVLLRMRKCGRSELDDPSARLGGRNGLSWEYERRRTRVVVVPQTRSHTIRLQMTSKHRPENGTVVYSHRDAPSSKGRTGADVYFVVDGDRVVPGVNIRYYNEDWIFWKTATILVGGERYTLSLGNFGVSRDNDIRGVYEWLATTADNPDHGSVVNSLFQAVADQRKGFDAVLVLRGDDYRVEYKLSQQEVERWITTVAAAYAHGWNNKLR